MNIYRFRNCLLNTFERQVIKDGKRLELTPKTFDVLQLLVEKSGEIVTKDEILGKVWNGSFVEEGNLPVHVSKLRRLLGETNTERFIETVAGTGYRFVAAVSNSNSMVSKRRVSDFDLSGNHSVAKSISENSESHKFYLKGKHFLEKRTRDDIKRAIECFRKSFAADPLSVASYVEIVECYLFLYILGYLSYNEVSAKMRPFLSIISDMDQQRDIVQAMYGALAMHLDWKFDDAEKHFQHALKLNPTCLVARYRYSDFLIFSGRYAEALHEVQNSLQIDPLSSLTFKRIGRLFWKMERYNTALIYLKEALELEPGDWETLLILGCVMTELGLHEEALLTLERSICIQFNIETLSMIGYVNAFLGIRDKACEIIKEIKIHSGDLFKNAIILARIYLALGEKEIVYQYLDLAFEQHDIDLIGLKFDPRWRTLRSESRFEALIEKVGLPVNQSKQVVNSPRY